MKSFFFVLLLAGTCSAQFSGYTGADIRPWPTVPNMGTNVKSGLVWNDTSLPSNPLSRVVRCTDQNTDPGAVHANQSKSAGLGGSGDAEQLFNTDSTLLVINTSGGQNYIIPFNPATMVCSPDITANLNDTNPGSASAGYVFGAGSFDWTDNGAGAGNSIYWVFGDGPDAPSNGLAKYVINKTTHHFTVTTPVMDFNPWGLPITTLNAPAWLPSHAYAFGDYVSAAITGLPDWNGATAWILGDLIVPLTNNPAGCAFKLSATGTRGAQPTQWSTGVSCTIAQQNGEGLGATHNCNGGVECYRNIGPPTFVFQLTSAGGTSGVGTPVWAANPGGGAQTVHPDTTDTVIDGSLTWTNVSTMIAPNWRSFAGISKDSNRICSGFSSNSYGHGVGSYNLDNSDQGTGVWAGCYDIAANVFSVLNTATGIQSKTSCSGGTGYTCSGGTFNKLAAVGAAYSTFTTFCSYPIHNVKAGSTLDYIVVTMQAPNPRVGYIGTCQGKLVDWQPFAAYASTNAQLYNAQSNHWTIGKKLFVNVGDSSALGTGTYTSLLYGDNPTVAQLTSWQPNPCDSPWSIGSVNPPCTFSNVYDSHLAFLHGPLDNDTGPVCGTIFDAQTGHPQPIAPYANEEICVTTSPNWDPVAGPIGAFKVWRFTHNFLTIANPFFDVQFGISQLSQDGKFLAFSSDWDCGLGDTSGNPTNTCGILWSKSTAYALGTNVNPFANTNGAGTNFGVWQVTNVGSGTSASVAPTWTTGGGNNCTPGTVVTDANGMQYTCLGSNNSKGEVFITSLSGLLPSYPSRLIRAIQ